MWTAERKEGFKQFIYIYIYTYTYTKTLKEKNRLSGLEQFLCLSSCLHKESSSLPSPHVPVSIFYSLMSCKKKKFQELFGYSPLSPIHTAQWTLFFFSLLLVVSPWILRHHLEQWLFSCITSSDTFFLLILRFSYERSLQQCSLSVLRSP